MGTSLVYKQEINILGIDMSKAFDTISRDNMMEIVSSFIEEEDEARLIHYLLAVSFQNPFNSPMVCHRVTPFPLYCSSYSVGSRLSESHYPISRLSKHLNVTMFSAAAGKRHSGHWSSATGESKAAI